MQKKKNDILFAASFFASLVVVVVLAFSIAFAKTNGLGSQITINGAEHRNTTEMFTQNLSQVADKEGGEIGEQVKGIVQEQDARKNKTADAIDKVQNRNGVKTFFIGTDYKNIGALRSEIASTTNQINNLKRMLDQTTNIDNKITIQTQINVLEEEQQKIIDFLKINEGKFSLFGWFVKFFNK